MRRWAAITRSGKSRQDNEKGNQPTGLFLEEVRVRGVVQGSAERGSSFKCDAVGIERLGSGQRLATVTKKLGLGAGGSGGNLGMLGVSKRAQGKLKLEKRIHFKHFRMLVGDTLGH